MNRRTYLVTGGTGFIGSALVHRLVRHGAKVRVVDNDLRGNKGRLAGIAAEIEFVAGDVRDVAAMEQAARGCSTILHLAALNGTENFYQRPELVLDVGVRGMYAMLQAARANDIREFIFASSSEVYQTPPMVPTPEDVPMTIPDPWNPRYSYGGSKLISELMLANYNRDLFERAIIFRPHNVYGPDMGWEHVIPQFAMRVLELAATHPDGVLPFPIQGDGSHTRAFIYIDDFLDGLMLILEAGLHRHVYHIGKMEEVSVARLAELVAAQLGRTVRIVPQPEAPGGTHRRCPDISRLQALGFAPQTTLAEGLARTVPWYVANAPQKRAAS
jgi:dTDP-glucose 4,6-dehydratase/UDP-glucose 4-epimerase